MRRSGIGAIGILLMSVAALQSGAQTPVTEVYSIDTGLTIMQVRTAETASGTMIVASSYEGRLLGIDYDGTTRWINPLSGFMNHDLWCADVTGDGVDEIFAANADGAVYCLDASGNLLWQFKPNEGGHLPPMYTVCVIKAGDSTPYVVCGALDMTVYYLSGAGSLVKTLASSTYSQEKPWGDTRPPDFLHNANFVRPMPQSDGTELLAIHGTLNHQQARGSIYQFEPLADQPLRADSVSAATVIGDFRVVDPDGDGNFEVLLGTSGINSHGFTRMSPSDGGMTRHDISRVGQSGYRVTQCEVIPDGSGKVYLTLIGNYIVLVPLDLNADNEQRIVGTYAFNDLWKGPDGRLILASAQSGGSSIHIVDPRHADWKTDFANLNPPGKIQSILANTSQARTLASAFVRPAHERDPLEVFLTWADSDHPTAQRIMSRPDYHTPVFMDGGNEDKEERSWRTSITSAEYRDRIDGRQDYVLTQQQAVDQYVARYADPDIGGIAFWGGHGNDPFFYQRETLEMILNGAGGKKTVMIWPELQDSSDEFSYVLENLFYPLAEHARTRNGNIFVRSKHVFWQGDVYRPHWRRLVAGEFADVFVSGMEETTDKAAEMSLAGRMGLWASGSMDDWGMRCSRDNPSFNRSRQFSYQRLPNHFLRTMVYSLASGSRYLNNTYVDEDYMSFAWELVASGALFVPQREEIVSFSPVHLSMLTPDEDYLDDGSNVKWSTYYDRSFEENNAFVFSRLNGSWLGAPVTDWDFSRYAAGVTERRQNFIPPYPNGMVLVTPPQSGPMADPTAARGRLEDHLNPIYADNLEEIMTDGRHYYSSDQSNTFAADEHAATVAAAIASASRKLPLTVSGDVAWVCAQTSPTHLRLTLIDSGYINPKARTATVTFHSATPRVIRDVLDHSSYDVSNPQAVAIDVPLGLFRFIEIELTEPLMAVTEGEAAGSGGAGEEEGAGEGEGSGGNDDEGSGGGEGSGENEGGAGEPQPGVLRNISTRSFSQGGNSVVVPGFVLSGAGTKRVLIRAIGPKLGDFGISEFLSNPTLSVYRGDQLIATNDDWGVQTPEAIQPGSVMSEVGAFGLQAAGDFPTNDQSSAALVLDLPAGVYSAHAKDGAGGAGVGLIEIYDAGSESDSSRIVNISNRGFAGQGQAVMIPGVVVEGELSQRFLVRAVGPKLADYGVPLDQLVSNPRVRIMRNGVEVASNDDWTHQTAGGIGDAAFVSAVSSTVGAFDLGASENFPMSDSQSAALVVDMAPGVYTIVVEGEGDETGQILAEVYEIPSALQ